MKDILVGIDGPSSSIVFRGEAEYATEPPFMKPSFFTFIPFLISTPHPAKTCCKKASPVALFKF